MSHTLAKKTDGVAAASWIQTLTNGNEEGPLSLYFHIPFCKKKCPYCHFYTLIDSEEQKSALYKALIKEITLLSPLYKNHEIVSIYFGGGTPYLFGPKRIQGLIDTVYSLATVVTRCEITLEANPEQVTKDDLIALRSAGLNRLSLGVQSFHETDLKLLERGSSVRTFSKAIENATHSGFQNLSLDLMYDLPEQSIADWTYSLEQALSYPITHLSLYNLTIEPKTAFHRREQELLARMPKGEESLLFYETAQSILQKNGFYQYEISAFARPGFQSLHNIGYWTARSYLGFGPSASGFYSLIRYTNKSNLAAYISALSEERLLFDLTESISKEDRFKELLVVGLRYFGGLSLSLLQQKTECGIPLETQATLTRLESDGFLTLHPLIQLTERGRLVYDSLASELL